MCCFEAEEDLYPSEFGSRYCDVDLLVTETVRELSEVYMTVRPPGHTHSQHSRRRSREAGGEMYDKKYSLDSDYREYYRDRPRGEFLTRGAALSSQAGAGPGGGRPAGHEGTYGSSAASRRQQPEISGAQSGPGYQQVSSTAVARIGRNASSEKIATARNPTILRKSKQ